MVNSHITITGNIFYNNSALFSSTVNILVTYVQDSEISHNDVSVAPYHGICHGYGWGANDAGGNPVYAARGLYKYQPVFADPTTSKNNLIKGNLIHSYGLSHTDLGALYTLSCSPGTLFIDNYGYDSDFKGLQPDEGSANLTYINNLLLNIGPWYDPNDGGEQVRTGNNTLIENFGRTLKNIGPRWALDGFPNHSGWRNNTFLRNRIVSSVSETSLVAQKAAYRAGVLPGVRTGRPVSNDPSLADAFIAVERADARQVNVNLTNFDDVDLDSVTFQASTGGNDLKPLRVPRIIPRNSFAVAIYELGETGVNVTASATYTNPRTGWKRKVSANGQV
jgi:hypothetical protein